MARTAKTYTDEQQGALDLARAKYTEYRRSRKTALERARLAAEAEVAERRREAAKAILAAYETGIAIRTIGREAMKTSDYVTVRAIIGEVDLGALREEREEQIAAQSVTQVQKSATLTHIDGDVYELTLAGTELDQAKAWANWDNIKEVPIEHRSARFERNESGYWLPQTNGWLAEVGEEHPVVVYATKDAGRAKLTELWEGLQ